MADDHPSGSPSVWKSRPRSSAFCVRTMASAGPANSFGNGSVTLNTHLPLVLPKKTSDASGLPDLIAESSAA